MKFIRNEDGILTLVEERKSIEKPYLTNQANIIDLREVKSYVKEMKFLDNKALSIAPVFILGAVDMSTGGAGIMWETFMKYIFPWMLDIAKVFCAIKIAQGFYQEHRGGKNGETGLGSIVTYGKWLLLFHLLPFAVTLIDQIGVTMFNGLSQNPVVK